MIAGGFVGKLLLTLLVIVVVWRGYRLWADMQRRVTQAADAGRARPARRPARPSVDLVACRLCGTYVPPGMPCPSREACLHQGVGGGA